MTDRTRKMNEREDILLSLYGTSKLDSIALQCARDIEKTDTTTLYAKYIVAVTLNQSANTIVQNFSIFRKHIRDAVVDKDTKKRAIELFEAREFGGAVAKMREEVAVEHIDIDIEKTILLMIRNIDDDLQKKIVDRDRKYLLYLFLGLMTGRRVSELLSTLRIVIDGKKLYYTGIAKKGDLATRVEAYPLVDIPAKRLVVYLQELQSIYATTKPSSQNRILAKNLYRLSGGIVKTTHDCRHIYMHCIQELELYTVDGETNEAYRRRMLGHKAIIDSTRKYGIKYEK